MAKSTTAKKSIPKVTFSISAPKASNVSVVGTFNQWNPGASKLEKGVFGVWKGTVALAPGSYQYRFVVDGTWVDDPGAKKTVTNEFGSKNAILEVK